MRVSYQFHAVGALLALSLSANVASAAKLSPVGVWLDHTGRGAVEIKPCGKKLCGHVVWARKKKDSKKGCGKKLIGNLRKINSRTWDRGWIYSPERGRRFDLEIKPVSANKLRILGYMGNKMFSKTMYWKRAPASLERCDREQQKADKPIIAQKSGTPKKETAKKKVAKVQADTAAPTKTVRAAAIVPPKPRPATRSEQATKPFRDVPDNEARIASREMTSEDGGSSSETARVQSSPDATVKKSAQDQVDDYQKDAEATKDDDVAEKKKPRKKQRTARYNKKKRCTINAPFVTVSFPCNK